MRWLIPYAVTAGVTFGGMAFCQHIRSESASIRVIDGDTIVFNGEHIRLYGIDAPEKNQECEAASAPGKGGASQEGSEPGKGEQTKQEWQAGLHAKWALQDLIRSAGTIHVERHGIDRYKRTLAVVTNEQAGDINGAMVLQGMAWAYTQYSWRYGVQQAMAKSQHVGIWAHDCVPAWEWRHRHAQ
jgi:endonuclease YncB( thermonuclease family)